MFLPAETIAVKIITIQQIKSAAYYKEKKADVIFTDSEISIKQ